MRFSEGTTLGIRHRLICLYNREIQYRVSFNLPVSPAGRCLMKELPSTIPENDPGALWSLQIELLGIAESLLGPRDTSRKIYPPQFLAAGPNVRHTPNQDGAFVEMSLNARKYWPSVVFEMAHETVHLLDPTLLGQSNYLEEGVAVVFSILVQPTYQIENVQYPTAGPYFDALSLVHRLPGNPITSARLFRDQVGPLSEASPEELARLFPSVDSGTLQKLAEKFAGINR